MIRWGIIGLGNIAQRFARSLAFSQTGTLTAVASRNRAKQQAYEQQYPGCVGYTDYAELLNSGHIDAVYIALPPGLHRKWSVQALQLGLGVLCEKPAVVRPAELTEILSAAQEHHAFFLEAMKSRFNPCIDQIQKLIASGEIGRITEVQASFCTDLDGDPQQRGSYLYEAGQGSTLLDMGVYPLTLIMALLGSDPVSVTGSIRLDQNQVDHHVTACLQYADGSQGRLEAAFDQVKERTAVITGTKGKLLVPLYHRPEEFTMLLNDGHRKLAHYPLNHDDMFGEIEAADSCLQAGQIESDRFSWQDSRDEARLLAEIRKNCTVTQFDFH